MNGNHDIFSAVSIIQQKTDDAVRVLDVIRESSIMRFSTEIVEGADVWLRDTYCAGLLVYLKAPVIAIIDNHGIEQAVGYLVMLRNQTFNKLDTVTKAWRRETLTDLIDSLNEIVQPPIEILQRVVEDKEEPSHDDQDAASAEPRND